MGQQAGVLAAQDGLLSARAAFVIVAGLLVAMVIASGFRRVGASERLVVRRFGRTRGVRGPGLRFLLPLADAGVRVPVGMQPHDIWLRATTRDGVPVRIKALAMMGADDPVRYASAADSPSSAAQETTAVALRAVIADRDLADLPSLMADGDDADLVRRVNEAVRPWGVAADLVSITDATVPVRAGLPICRCGTVGAELR
ncbi:SPFH domain-containing protein [Spirillospora sp. NPDC048819]|uniref:SPFH domain-containing protein n=1 Tax=Spirillospora sp. NPDC048819 TaxID=3155268 RepID=UPI003406E9D5